MKKTLGLVFGVLLVFGLVLVSCSSGDKGTAPKVTVAITETTTDGSNTTITNNPKTSFAIGERVGMRFTITDPDKDVSGYGYTIKRDGTVTAPRREFDFGQINNGSTTDTCTTATWWSFGAAGAYTIEAYALDVKGNKSPTATANFTVK
jgi:hypothetical protein